LFDTPADNKTAAENTVDEVMKKVDERSLRAAERRCLRKGSA